MDVLILQISNLVGADRTGQAATASASKFTSKWFSGNLYKANLDDDLVENIEFSHVCS